MIGPGAIVGQRCVIHGISVIGAGAVIASGTVTRRRTVPVGELIVRALVTGGAGFIGSTLVDRLLAEGHTVDVIDDLSTGSLANLAEARASADHQLTVPPDWTSARPRWWTCMARRSPEVVFHLAAQADVRVSVADPVFDADVNLIGTLRILEGARAAGAGPGGLRGQRRDPLRRARRVRAPAEGVAAPASPVPLRGVEEGGHRLPGGLPGAALARVRRPGPGQRLRPATGPPRRGRASWPSSPSACSGGSR